MQVFGIKGLERKEPIRKMRKASSTSVFSVEASDDGISVQEESPVSSMHSIQSILSLQTMPLESLEATNYQKGENLLGKMDKLLNATLAENQADKASSLINLVKEASAMAERSSDAGLEDVLDEIKLRAAVELAKNRSRA